MMGATSRRRAALSSFWHHRQGHDNNQIGEFKVDKVGRGKYKTFIEIKGTYSDYYRFIE